MNENKRTYRMPTFHTLTFEDIQDIILRQKGDNWLPVLEAVTKNGVNGDSLAQYMQTTETLYQLFNNEINCKVSKYIIKELHRLICKAAEAKNDACYGAGSNVTNSKQPGSNEKRKINETYSTPAAENKEKAEDDDEDKDDTSEPPSKQPKAHKSEELHCEYEKPSTWALFTSKRQADTHHILQTAITITIQGLPRP